MMDAKTWNALPRDARPGDLILVRDRYGSEEIGMVVEDRRSLFGFYLGELTYVTVRHVRGAMCWVCSIMAANAPVIEYAPESDRQARLQRAEALYIADLAQHEAWQPRIAAGWRPGWTVA